MRDAAAVLLRAVVFIAVWVIWGDSSAPAPGDGGMEWLVLVAILLIALLWGLVDGLIAHGGLSRAFLRWGLTAPATALLLPVAWGIDGGGWPGGIDTVRSVTLLVGLFYFLIVLPAGLGVALGSGAQSLGRWVSRG